MNKDSKPIEFEGVKFSDMGLKELRNLQERGDEILNAYINDLTNLVFHLIKHNESLISNDKSLDMYLGLLVLIRETFMNLRSKNEPKAHFNW